MFKLLNKFIKGEDKHSLLYDDQYYSAQNQDLRNLENLKEHYEKFGVYEGRNPSMFFDPIFCYMNNKELFESDKGFPKDIYHRSLKNPSILFDTKYFEKVSSISSELPFLKVVGEYIKSGMDRQKSISQYFDLSYYLDKYEDVRKSSVSPMKHYILYGENEGRKPNSNFDPNHYTKPQMPAGWNHAKYTSISKLEFHALESMGLLEEYFNAGFELFNKFKYIKEASKKKKVTKSKLFHESYYKRVYADLQNIDLEWHYFQYGQNEGRKPNPFFDPNFYKKESGLVNEKNLLEHYANVGYKKGIPPHPLFDINHILKQVEIPEGVNYLQYFFDNTDSFRYISTSPHFDIDFYINQLEENGIEIDAHPILHYMEEGEALGLLPNSTFKPIRYIKENDGTINHAAFNSYSKLELHLNKIGLNLDYYWNEFKNQLELCEHEEVVLFLSHDASRTGAPLIIKHISDQFNQLFDVCNVNIIINKAGLGLLEDFKSVGPTYTISEYETYVIESEIHKLIRHIGAKRISAAYVNSAESRVALPFLASYDFPIISLIHEMAYYYPKNEWSTINDYSDKVIFPSNIVKNFAYENFNFDEEKVIVRGQGIFPDKIFNGDSEVIQESIRKELNLPKDSRIVLGCGTTIERKGIDYFVKSAISCLNYFKKNDSNHKVYFVWLGKIIESEFYDNVIRDIEKSKWTDQILFIGERKRTQEYFVASDIFYMSSKGDPFPCVVLEAMDAKLPIVCFKDSGGYTEILKNDVSGVIAEYGDTFEASSRIINLIEDDDFRNKLGDNAYEFLHENYIYKDYVLDLSKILIETNKVNQDWLAKINKVTDNHQIKYERSRKVIFTLSDYWISGVTTVVLNTIVGLLENGYDAYILFTNKLEEEALDEFTALNIPYKILDYNNGDSLKDKWSKIVLHLEANSPCVVLPHVDYVTSAISPVLSNDVGIIGTLHSDDVEHYEHGYRLGHYWNKIVSVSDTIQEKMCELNPAFEAKSTVIWNGIEANKPFVEKSFVDEKLIIVYTGRMSQYQKLILDYATVVEKLVDKGIDFEFHFVGDGSEHKELMNSLEKYVLEGYVVFHGKQNREFIYEILERAHVFSLISEFEGVPMSLLEAMANSCVPVLTDIESGIKKIITSGMNGLTSPIFDYDLYVDNIAKIANDEELFVKLSKNSYDTLSRLKLTDKDMSKGYADVIDEVFEEISSSKYARQESLTFRSPTEKVLPSPMNIKV